MHTEYRADPFKDLHNYVRAYCLFSFHYSCPSLLTFFIYIDGDTLTQVQMLASNIHYLFTGIKCQLAPLSKVLMLQRGLWIGTATPLWSGGEGRWSTLVESTHMSQAARKMPFEPISVPPDLLQSQMIQSVTHAKWLPVITNIKGGDLGPDSP